MLSATYDVVIVKTNHCKEISVSFNCKNLEEKIKPQRRNYSGFQREKVHKLPKIHLLWRKATKTSIVFLCHYLGQ